MAGEMKQARRNDAGPVDHHPDDLAIRRRDSSVDGRRRRGRGVIDPDQTKIPFETRDQIGIERGIRAIVDDDHFVIVRVDMALIGG